jgi:hypothetical protein
MPVYAVKALYLHSNVCHSPDLGVPSRLVQHVEREVLSWIKKKFRKNAKRHDSIRGVERLRLRVTLEENV